jgi:hypothetical protein
MNPQYPPINCITSLEGRPELWRVVCCNEDQGLAFLEYVGRRTGRGEITLADGSVVTLDAFDEHRACRWPMAHDRRKGGM